MHWVRGIAKFCWDFVIGDDWLVTVLITLGLSITYLIAHSTTAPIWWLPPLVVLITLPVSIVRLIQRHHQ